MLPAVTILINNLTTNIYIYFKDIHSDKQANALKINMEICPLNNTPKKIMCRFYQWQNPSCHSKTGHNEKVTSREDKIHLFKVPRLHHSYPLCPTFRPGHNTTQLLLIKSVVLYLGSVTVECVSCASRRSELRGVVGGNITMRYTFIHPFSFVKIFYNRKQNEISISSYNDKVNTDKVTDNRFIIPEKTSGTGDTRSVEITLTKLSLNDTNLTFDYIYSDVNAREHPGSNTLIVYGIASNVFDNFCYAFYH